MTPEQNFWARVRIGSNCWEWTGTLSSGYGQLIVGPNRARDLAHRFAYKLLVGPIPDELQIDHLCRNRGCVNPAHMELVTIKENVLRGVGISAQNARKTHCKRGHPFDSENTGRQRSGSRERGRYCRQCYREADARRRATLKCVQYH